MSIVFRIFNNVDDVIFRRTSEVSDFVVNYTIITEIPQPQISSPFNFFNNRNEDDLFNSVFNENRISPFMNFIETIDSILENRHDLSDHENQIKGVSKELIKKTLGRYNKVTKNNIDSFNDKCAVCQDTFEVNQCYRKLQCNHIFHKKCIDPWFNKHSQECPVCRKNVFRSDK